MLIGIGEHKFLTINGPDPKSVLKFWGDWAAMKEKKNVDAKERAEKRGSRSVFM